MAFASNIKEGKKRKDYEIQHSKRKSNKFNNQRSKFAKGLIKICILLALNASLMRF